MPKKALLKSIELISPFHVICVVTLIFHKAMLHKINLPQDTNFDSREKSGKVGTYWYIYVKFCAKIILKVGVLESTQYVCSSK